jgi:hypothetical protein
MTDSSWWKSYAVYLVIVAPFLVLDALFIHARWIMATVTGVIVFAGLTVKDRVQRRIWP